ncbi:E3 ubiquitin-protein ligase RKP-like isoform X1 [Macadamia integrifolia]|uniref:E3 ubiquitin-protein ligase RKP-like isoform X1 n=1 Tax=Macadamia integrifolia TaxID=60698 RepID=UPI001C4EC26A|nr:E3 ubiquitin-protein ligase RKP-like isoform X1 [Macadamia integrifolia]XP_042506373.1 E3 ubiquitin-protein ligase RKP-like isoform X1 [Macadamia integrifolia]
MSEDGQRIGGLTSGLALILTSEDQRESPQKSHLISFFDDFGYQSVERTLEHIFQLPYKSVRPLPTPFEASLIHSILKNDICKFRDNQDAALPNRDGICITDSGCGPHNVTIDDTSICGDIRIIKQPLIIESQAMFSSVRANACVWKGKWMYEVILETSGIQQLGWATLSCPFTEHKGVGDAEDSYAFDGRRVSKWNKEAERYGQSWVVGDVIGCCIDLDRNEISFYRNGLSLGVAFDNVRKMAPGLGYYPAISLSQGERCNLNFGAHPFNYPIQGFYPLQSPPTVNSLATHLLQCFFRLLELQRMEKADSTSVEKLGRLKRFAPIKELFQPIAHAICEEFFCVVDMELGGIEYVCWGPLVSFLMDAFRKQSPHDFESLDGVIDLFLEFQGSRMMFQHVISSLSCSCKIATLVLTECPYSGSYSYLALVCHILRREELMVLWWESSDFDFLFEGFLSRKGLNKQDLQCLMPSVWWPGSCEDVSYESCMMLTTATLSGAVSKIEEMHRKLCCLVIEFVPPITPPQLPGSVFMTFLQNLLLKNRGADRNLPPPGVSSNSVIVSLYTVILHFLSEGFAEGDICRWIKGTGTKAGDDVGFLHRAGQRSFPVGLFLKNDPHRTDISRLGGSFNHILNSHPANDGETEVFQWEEGCMDDEETKVTHSTRQKPCCCSSSDIDFTGITKDPIQLRSKGSRAYCSPLPDRSTHVAAECSTGSLNDDMVDKASSSDQSEPEFSYRPLQHHLRNVPKRASHLYSATLREEELLDAMLLLYHIGLAPNFKQASYYMSHQSQSISLLEETDKQIKEKACNEQLKRLKESRNGYREEVIDCVRHCAWYRISLSSQWKQRGMYATCRWIVELLLVLSKMDSLFIYIPEFYLEALVDCFHALRRSDPPFVPSTVFLKHGLASFVTFIVTHFNDSRISSADLRDLLLHSISVLLQYKDYLIAFESNAASVQTLPRALLSAFDNRSWIPVTNILLRLFKGSGFGSSKHGELSSTLFQGLLRDTCIHDEALFSAFLNRLFNTLSWTMTEFSVSVREMQEKYQVLELQQRKCIVIFDLSCNLARVLEFCTHEIPQAFLAGSDMNLRRLTELVVFILNHETSAADAEFFDIRPLRRLGQSQEKINRGMILAPLVGIILNLLDASLDPEFQNDLLAVFASMDCPVTVQCGIQYLLEYNWAGSLRGNPSSTRLRQLEQFSGLLRSRTESREAEKLISSGEAEDDDDDQCCICYTSVADAWFEPCSHTSCYGCITRHLLNCQRCFFCNAVVLEVHRNDEKTL